MIADFLMRTATVNHGGRRFRCTRPSMRTVLRAVDLFQDYIASATTVGGVSDVDPAHIIPQLAEMHPDRAGFVLETCVHCLGVDIVEACRHDPSLARSLAWNVCSLANIERISDSLSFSHLTENVVEPADAEEAITGLERAIVAVSRMFGTSPEQVVEWPYEQWLGVLDVLREEREEADPKAKLHRLAHEMLRDRKARAEA